MLKLKNKLVLILSILMIVSIISACSPIQTTVTSTTGATTSLSTTTNGETTTSSTTAKSYKVAVSILDAGNTLYVDLIKGVKSQFTEVDTVTVVDCQNNAAKQAEQIESLANAGYDGIVMLPADAAALSPAAKECMKKGTKILTWVTRLEQADAHMTADPYTYGGMLGKTAGEWIKAKWPNEKVVEVGMLTYNTIPEVVTRQEGMVKEMQKVAPNAQVVAQKDAASPDQGLPAAEAFLQAYPNMKVIIGINDGGAIGAYRAYLASGKDLTDVFVGGCDGIKEALELIEKEDSIYRCTVSVNPYDCGVQFALNLKNMLAGKEYWKESQYNMKVVTKDNVQDFMIK